MNVYLGGRVIETSKDQPVLIHLNKKDRENIANMPDDALGIYAAFPNNVYTKEEKEKFIEEYEEKWKNKHKEPIPPPDRIEKVGGGIDSLLLLAVAAATILGILIGLFS